MELKKDIDSKQITANGNTYYLESELSIERFIAFQKLEVELAYQTGFAGVMKALDRAKVFLNKTDFVSASVEITNIQDVMRKSDKDKRIPSIDICSLFLNTKDEDRRWITDQMLEEKQKDFESEGIPVSFFLTLAQNLVIGYKEHLKTEA